MKKVVKRITATLMVAIMLLTVAPLSGFVGFELPGFGEIFSTKAEASSYSGTCGENLTWSLDTDTGVLTISGMGVMNNYTKHSDSLAPWYSYSSSIKTVNIANSVTTIGDYAFYDCDSLTNVTIPDSVITIDNAAFFSCDSLTNVTIGNGVTTIGGDAFNGCDSLANVTIPNSVTTIDDGAFCNCNSLTNVTIGNSVTTIGDSAFYSCDSLTNVTIGNGVTTIGDYAFAHCDSLKSVTIPDSVTRVPEYAFYDCDSLIHVKIGNGVEYIAGQAFLSCDSLSSITVDDNNQYYSSDSYGVLFNKEKTELVQYPIGNARTNYSIPNSVKTIGHKSFIRCKSLTSITIPVSVERIDSDAFTDCDGLTSIIILGSSATVGHHAFSDCNSLSSIIIGNGVESILQDAFTNCDSITSITVDDNNQYYSSDSYGVLFNKDKTTLINYPIANIRTSYEIPDSVTTIDYSAFASCKYLTSVTIPDSVTTIGTYAFYNCKYFSSIMLPDSVITIGDSAFKDCDSFTSITIPDSVTTIGDYSFYDCDSLISVTIGNGVTTIGGYAFYDCESLTSITIPDSVTTIGRYAFYLCDTLRSLTIGNGVTTIGDYAFCYCKNLKSVIIPDNVTKIGSYAFAYCCYLRYKLPAKAIIGQNAFLECGTKVPIDAINISSDSYKCAVGKTFFISGDIQFECDLEDIVLTWRSDDGIEFYMPESIVKSSANNASFSIEVKGVKEGTYTVTVLCGGESDSCTVEVVELMVDVEINLAYESYTNINGALKTKAGTAVSSVNVTVVLKNNMTEKALENIELDLLLTDPNVYSGLSFEKNRTELTKLISVDLLNPGEIKKIELKLYPCENKFSSNTEIEVNVTVDGEFIDTYKSNPIALNYKIISYGQKDSRAEVFSFFNKEKDFIGSGEESVYLISSDSLGKLSWVDKPIINIASKEKWKGSCYGMLAMIVAFEQGWSSASDYGSSSVNSLEAPVNNIKLRDAINIMQCIQDTLSFSAKVDIANFGKTQVKKRKELVAAVKNISNGGIVPVLGIEESKENGAGHVVLAYNIIEKGNDYIIYVYDPSLASQCGVVTIAKDYSSYSYDLGSNYDEIKYVITDRSLLDINSFVSSPIARMGNAEEIYDFTLMTASDFDELTIENANGKKTRISYTEGVVEGDLEVYVDTVAGGDTGVLKIIIKDNPNETNIYKVKSSSRGMKITVNNNHIIADAVVGADATLYYSSNGVARLEGLNNSEYELSLVDGANLAVTEMLLTTVNGKNANEVEMKIVDDKIKVSGDNLANSELAVVKNDEELSKETSGFTSDCVVVDVNNAGVDVKDVETSFGIRVNSVSVDNISMNYKASATLTPKIDADSGVAYTVTYSSSNPSVVSVDENGNVSTNKTGSATITVTVTDEYGNTVTDTCEVNVKYSWWQWILIILLFGWLWY